MQMLFVDLFRIQLAMLEGWLNVTTNFSHAYHHTAKLNHDLLEPATGHRWHDERGAGPEWTDHYGKRCHDIDVEHML
jgi:hypothetical protein